MFIYIYVCHINPDSQVGYVSQVKMKPLNCRHLWFCTNVSAIWRCLQFEG